MYMKAAEMISVGVLEIRERSC